MGKYTKLTRKELCSRSNTMWAGSSVVMATGYGLDGPGSNPGGGEIFRTCPDRPWGPPTLLYTGYRVFPVGKERPGRDADLSPLLVPWSRKSRAIPLLPLWAVWPVQSLSACIRVHFALPFSPPMPSVKLIADLYC